MTPGEVQRGLYDRIPLSRAMGVTVLRADLTRVELAAPLAPNLNPHATVFGGSGVSLAILAAWTVLELRERAAGGDAQLVIQRSGMHYERRNGHNRLTLRFGPTAAAWRDGAP